jgi:hypothetical protein
MSPPLLFRIKLALSYFLSLKTVAIEYPLPPAASLPRSVTSQPLQSYKRHPHPGHSPPLSVPPLFGRPARPSHPTTHRCSGENPRWLLSLFPPRGKLREPRAPCGKRSGEPMPCVSPRVHSAPRRRKVHKSMSLAHKSYNTKGIPILVKSKKFTLRPQYFLQIQILPL